MATVNQLLKKKNYRLLKKKKRFTFLLKKPQRKAHCVLITWVPPKKPNSGRRQIAKIAFRSLKKKTFSYIPGQGHNLKKHSIVLIRGGRTKDVPGLKYKIIRGWQSAEPVHTRRRARSKYGTKMWQKKIKRRGKRRPYVWVKNKI